MAKTLSTALVIEKNRKFGTSPINLLVIEFGGVVGTKYYSDRTITVGSNVYEPVVMNWGAIDFILADSNSTNDVHLVLSNTQISPISDLFTTIGPEGKVAKVYQFYTNLVDADKVIVFDGRITSPVTYSLEKVELDLVNRILDLKLEIAGGISLAWYPRALPAHVGRSIPQIIGHVEKVPAVCVDTAGKSILRETLTDGSMVIKVEDGSVFPISGSWVLIIEDEKILMQANPSRVHDLSATTRGYDGTTQALHTKGTHINEEQTAFYYKVFEGGYTGGSIKAKVIENIRVNGYLLDSSQYTIDQDNYPGQIIFDEYPVTLEEKETVFDDYLFDTIINDVSVPYGETPEAITDEDNNSTTSKLNSGQQIAYQRVASLNNSNQLKRTYLTVKYHTDVTEWDGNVEANVYWNGNLLGALPDPTFDEVPADEPEEVPSTLEVPLTYTGNPISPPTYNVNSMIQGAEAVIETTFSKEDIEPSSLELETITYNPAAYGGETGLESVPIAWWTATVEGLTVKVLMFEHRVVGSFATTWESDARNFQYFLIICSGFRFSPPSGLTARITKLTLNWDDNLEPFNLAGRSGIQKWEYKKKGVFGYNEFYASSTGLKHKPLFVENVDDIKVYIQANAYISSRENWNVGEFNPLLAQLWGSITNIYLQAEYEVTQETPTPSLPIEDPILPVVVPEPVRQSHEVEKTFEITGYINSWSNLENTTAEIKFENEGELSGTNLYVKEFFLMVESSAYTFEFTDEITADVSGYYVDGTVLTTEYGEMDTLINRPDNVFKLLLTWESLFDFSDLDAAYYAVAAVFFIANKYRVDFAIVNPTTLRELLEKLAFQTRTDQYWEQGVHRIKVLELLTAVTKQLNISHIGEITGERSDVEDLINILEIRYTIDYSFLVSYTPNKFRDVLTVENEASQEDEDIGIRKNVGTKFFFDYIRDSVTVNHIAQYYLSYHSTIRKYYKVKCFLDQIELDKHDTIGLTFPLDNLVGASARILSNTLNMGSSSKIDSIEFMVLLEDYTYYKIEIADGVEFSDAVQLLLVPSIIESDNIEIADSIIFSILKSLGDSVSLSDEISFSMTKQLVIYDGYADGFGIQSWGNSAWGGLPVSLLIEDELTITRILAAGTGLVRPEDVVAIGDITQMILVTPLAIAGVDEFLLNVQIADVLTIAIS